MAANGKYMPYLIKNICRRTGLNTKCEKQGTAVDAPCYLEEIALEMRKEN